MSTVTESLYLAVLEALQGMPGLVAVHDRTRAARFIEEELPCGRLLEGSDIWQESIGQGLDLREVEIKLELYAGEGDLQRIDTWRQSAIERICGSPDVVKLSDWITVSDRDEPERNETDGVKTRVVQRFRIKYAASSRSLSR